MATKITMSSLDIGTLNGYSSDAVQALFSDRNIAIAQGVISAHLFEYGEVRKTNAIRTVRDAGGFGLKEAKDLVELTLEVVYSMWLSIKRPSEVIAMLSDGKLTRTQAAAAIYTQRVNADAPVWACMLAREVIMDEAITVDRLKHLFRL